GAMGRTAGAAASGAVGGADNRNQRGAPIGVPWGAVVADVLGVVGAQTLFVVLVALVVRSGPARPTLLSAALGTIALGLPAALLGTLAGRHRLRTAWRTLPAMLRSSTLCGAGAFASLIAIAAFGVALVLAATLPEVAGAERSLDVGVLGGIGLAATQLALLPNLMLWGLAYALGPGFRTGPGLVRVDMVHPADLPDLPVLAALPPNALPRPGWLVLALVPIVAGIVLVAMVNRATAGSRSRDRLATVLGAGVTCGLLTGLAIQASIGRVGGVDSHYGPTAGWVCGLLAGGEVAAVGLLLLGGIDLAARRAERPFLAEDAEPSFWRRRMPLPGSGLSARPSRRPQ
ncbi:cell division protein PerM, partial [Frankia gtarii]